MVGDSLSFPTKGEDGLMRSVIGGALILAGFVVPIVPQMLLYGYSLQAMRAGATGNPRPPEFDDWEAIFKDGLKSFVVVFAYSVVPLFLFFAVFVMGMFVFSFGAAAGSAAGSEGAAAGGGIGLLIMLGLGGVVFLLMMLAYYVLPAALVGVATEDEISAAFDFDSIKRIAFTGDYFVAVVVTAIVNTVGGLLAFVLMFLLVGFPIAFVLQAGIAHYMGTVVRDIATY